MVRPVVDVSHAAQGELHFNTSPIVGKIPNPIIQLLVKQVHKIVADSGYVNVTITIKQSPPLEETRDARGQVALKLRKDNPDLKGPVIEITTLDGLFAGDFTLAMTRDGFMAKIPPPKQLLKSVARSRNRTNAPAMAAIGSVPASQGFGAQQEGRFDPIRADSAGFNGSTPVGPQTTRQMPMQRMPISSAAVAPQPPRQMPVQRIPTSSVPVGPQTTRQMPMQRMPTSSAAVAPQPPRPVPMHKIPTSSAQSRAPVPANAFSQSGNRPSGGRPDQYQGQQQGFDKKSDREKGGCCSCFGSGSGSGSSKAAGSGYNNPSMSKDTRNKSEKERRRKEKKERKKVEKRMKKQKKKGKNSGYGGSGGIYAEKSGFYDDRKKRGGCCGWSCC